MLRNILILFNIAIIVLFNVFVAVDLRISQNFPSEVEPGNEYTFELSVTKGSITGFAKIQQDLPAGFTATEVESKGASFTFSDNKVKLIWMSLPPDETFTVSYKVKVADNVKGEYSVGGKFSYLENNERKSYDIPPAKVAIKATAEEAAAKEASNASSQPVAAMSANCTRTITEEGGKHKVIIAIKSEGITGFAKAQDNLPAGMKAEQVEAGGAVFSFTGQKAKFVWMSFPAQKELTISYYVSLEGKPASELNNIMGDFSYLENNETKKSPIVMQEAKEAITAATSEKKPDEQQQAEVKQQQEQTQEKQIQPDTSSKQQATQVSQAPDEEAKKKAEEEQAAAEKARQEQAAVEKAKPSEEQAATEKARQEEAARKKAEESDAKKAAAEEEKKRKAEEKAALAAKKSSTKLTGTPVPQTGVGYRVQVCAGHQPVGSDYIEKTYKFTENPVMTENHEGWIKYTVGAFGMYSEARDRRNTVTSSYNFPGPFVSAYNNGTRITVQEALMITHQKWVK